MSKIIEKYQVLITETTIKQLLEEIEKTRDINLNCKIEKNKKEKILVKSYYSDVEFLISLEMEPHSQESLGYQKV